ncbi:MAG TPA: MarR family winged helix-turn-helix transcriptional regulator [Terriglobales bacterium]|nr:MarR family winged helix-turn-helix transcriptional regulator [Terriglobales bacterium]
MKSQPPTPSLPCLCAGLRRAARALTQIYDAALRPTGLRATQFTVLQALSLTGEVQQGALGRMLALDTTTLTRTLGILQRNGWIENRPGMDRRAKLVRLTRAGEGQLRRAWPCWEALQDRLRQSLGNGRWHQLLHAANDLPGRIAHSTMEKEMS